MRLDKFLAVSRLIKRRTIAQQACDAGRVLVNGNAAKSSRDIKPGDELEIGFGSKAVRVRIEQVPTGNVRKEQAEALYTPLAT